MRSSSRPPSLPADSRVSGGGTWLLLVAVALVPLFWLPGFHSGFETPRRALVLVVIGPLAALLVSRNWAQRELARVPVFCVLAILAAGILPHLGSLDIHTAWRSARFLAPVMAFVIAGAVLMHPDFSRRLHLALVLPAIPVLAIGLTRRFFGFPQFLPDRPDVAISSTLGNSNELGEAFAPVFLAALALAPRMPGRTGRVLMWAGCAAALALVALSSSRGAWLAAAAGLAVQGVLWVRARWRDREVIFRAMVAALIALIAFFVLLGLPAGERLRDTLKSFVSTTHPTNVVRLETWKATLRLVADKLPFGAGLGRFEAAFIPYRSPVEWQLSGLDTRVDNPHQEFLWIASETGIAGTLAFLGLLAVALLRATRRKDQIDDVMEGPKRALLLSTVALIVLALFRAPLHHPSGVVTFAALLGSVAPRVLKGRRPWTDLVVVPVLGACLILAALDASEDLELGRGISAFNEAKAARARGDADRAADLVLESGRRLKTVPDAILKDFDRSFRAALASGELADVKDGLRVASPQKTFPDLPDHDDVQRLLDEVLRLCPRHPGATTQLALLWLKEGSVARAVAILKEAVAALPEAPRFRQNLAWIYARSDQFADAWQWMGEEVKRTPAPRIEDRLMLASYALGLGRDPSTFGRYLGPAARGAHPPIAPGLEPIERRRAILLHLLDEPADGQALADLAQIDYALVAQGEGAPELAPEANRAFARSRVRFAVDAVAGGDSAQAEAYLRLAVQKDAGLLDAHVLRAKVAVREGRLDDCVASLRATLDRGVRLEVLRSWIEQDPDLRRHLSDGRLAALGL